MSPDLQKYAEKALGLMIKTGFEHSQATVCQDDFDELNIVQNSVALFRTVSKPKIDLVGIIDGRKATLSIPLSDEATLKKSIKNLLDSVQQAPQDPANTLSQNQRHDHIDGHLQSDKPKMVAKLQALLQQRQAQFPNSNINEGYLKHRRSQKIMLNSQNSQLQSN